MAETPSSHALKVSVIIPTYNRAGYLREALDSVLAQTLPPWEIIVVDDGSTDDTAHVVAAYGSYIRYVQHGRNQGIPAARNSGLQSARGDLIAWLDSDDLWEPAFLSAIIATLADDATLDGAYTGIAMVDANGTRLGEVVHVEPPDQLYTALACDSFLATSSLVVARSCYDQVGGFDPAFAVLEDYDLWLRLAKRFRIAGIPRPLVCIREHETNTMANIDTLCQARLALALKHFGEPRARESGPADAAQRAYGHALRFAALQHIQVGRAQEGWHLMEQAIFACPALLEELDTFYELACGDQPRSCRGDARLLDIALNGGEMLAQLDALFAEAPPSVLALRQVALANAHLSLGMLSDQAGHWRDARRHLMQAARHNPRLVTVSFIRRIAKLSAGKASVAIAKSICSTAHKRHG